MDALISAGLLNSYVQVLTQTLGGDYHKISGSDSDSDSGLRFHTHGRLESSW